MNDAFIGRAGFGQLDLMRYLDPGSTGDKILYLATIQDAVSHYLFFGVGKHGNNADEFAYSTQYLFKVRSSDKRTWEHRRVLRSRSRTQVLTDQQLMNMCFDRHYENSGLSNLMAMDTFLDRLKDERRQIIVANWRQVTEYLSSIREKETRTVPEGNQLPLRIWAPDEQGILIEPEGPRQIAEMLFYNKQTKQQQTHVTRAQRTALPKYKRLFDLGVFNDESIPDDRTSSVPSTID